MRKAGDALFDRQGQLGDAAPGAEGLLSRRGRRSRCCTSTRPGSSGRCTRCATGWRASSGMELIVHINPEAVARGINPFTHGSAVHTDVMEDAGAQAGARQVRLRRARSAAPGATRRRSRAKERVFSFRSAAAPLGSQEPAPRAVAPLQHPQAQGREHPRVPAVELDRARRLAIHLPREHPDRAALLRAAERPVVRARRRADHGGRRPHAAAAGRDAR